MPAIQNYAYSAYVNEHQRRSAVLVRGHTKISIETTHYAFLFFFLTDLQADRVSNQDV